MVLIRMFPGEDALGPEETEKLLDDEPDWADGTRNSNLYGQTKAPAQASEVDPLADEE